MENKKVIKRLAIAIGVLMAFLVGIAFGNDGVSKEDLAVEKGKVERMIDTIDDKNSQIEELTKSKEELDTLKETTKDYTSLTENEKKIVNEKIVEVKNATQEQKEAEQRAIEEEKARKEAEEKAKKEAEEQAKREEAERKKAEEEAKKAAEEQAKREAEEKAKEEQRKQTEYGNVIKAAQNYLEYMNFSRQGLIKQLEFEGYSTEASEYAVDNISVDWNEQCAKTAQNYLEYMSFSRDGLYNQLAFEGFTDEQIQYGLSKVGY